MLFIILDEIHIFYFLMPKDYLYVLTILFTFSQTLFWLCFSASTCFCPYFVYRENFSNVCCFSHTQTVWRVFPFLHIVKTTAKSPFLT